MLEIYIKLIPVFAFFFLGVLLKTLRFANDEHGAKLLKFMFYFTLPILVLVKVSEAQIDPGTIYLPFMNMGINLICLGVMIVLTRKMDIEPGILGVMLVSAMIINNFFMFPFILTVLGDEAFVEVMIFDIGNGITTLTVAYAIAFKYGPEELKTRNILNNIIRLPAMWAIVIAIFLNFNEIHLPNTAIEILDPLGMLTNPIILIALGIYFSLRMKKPGLLLMTITVRMLLGLIIAVVFVMLFDLQGTAAMVVILGGAAPIGFNSLTFSSLARLDMTFASSAISLSILIGLFTIPLLLYLLQSSIKI